MKNISIRISADGESIGAFTFDPYTTIRLLADARANPMLTLTEFVHESLRNEVLRDDYDGELHCADTSGIVAEAIAGTGQSPVN